MFYISVDNDDLLLNIRTNQTETEWQTFEQDNYLKSTVSYTMGKVSADCQNSHNKQLLGQVWLPYRKSNTEMDYVYSYSPTDTWGLACSGLMHTVLLVRAASTHQGTLFNFYPLC